MQDVIKSSGKGVEFRLTVWLGHETGWHARVVGPDNTEHEFASPFELARYVAWPGPTRDGNNHGLR